MSIATVDRLVEQDIVLLKSLAGGGQEVLADGSAYSPSWRALPGGHTAYQLGFGAEYDEAFEEALSAWGGAFWEDGMLIAGLA